MKKMSYRPSSFKGKSWRSKGHTTYRGEDRRQQGGSLFTPVNSLFTLISQEVYTEKKNHLQKSQTGLRAFQSNNPGLKKMEQWLQSSKGHKDHPGSMTAG